MLTGRATVEVGHSWLEPELKNTLTGLEILMSNLQGLRLHKYLLDELRSVSFLNEVHRYIH